MGCSSHHPQCNGVENGGNIQITMILGNWCTCADNVYQALFFTVRFKKKNWDLGTRLEAPGQQLASASARDVRTRTRAHARKDAIVKIAEVTK